MAGSAEMVKMFKDAMPWRSPIATIAGLVLGLLLSPAVFVAMQTWLESYDRDRPAWVPTEASVLSWDGKVLKVHVAGEKRRDCDPVRTWAQATYADRLPTDAQISRMDGRPIGYIRRPLGPQDLGDFAVQPVPPDAVGAVLRVEHDCSGRTVASVLAEVKLRGK